MTFLEGGKMKLNRRFGEDFDREKYKGFVHRFDEERGPIGIEDRTI